MRRRLFNSLYKEKLSFTKLSILVDYSVRNGMKDELNYLVTTNNLKGFSNDMSWENLAKTAEKDFLIRKLEIESSALPSTESCNWVTYCLAKSGHPSLLPDRDLSFIMKGAVEGKNKELIETLLRSYPELKSDTALCAIQRSNQDLLVRMVNSGANEWDWMEFVEDTDPTRRL